MAQSAQRAIRAAVAALMKASPALAGGLVFENRDYKLPEGVAAQVHVNYDESTPEPVAIRGNPIDWTTALELVVKARRSGGTSAEDAADALWAEAYARLMADQSLGGLVQALEPDQVSVDDDEADTDTCRLTWRFTVTHRTSNNSITRTP